MARIAVQAIGFMREYTVTQLFGPGASGQGAMDRCCEWLQKLPSHKLPLAPATSVTLTANAVRAIERAQEALCSQARGLSSRYDGEQLIRTQPHILNENYRSAHIASDAQKCSPVASNLYDSWANVCGHALGVGRLQKSASASACRLHGRRRAARRRTSQRGSFVGKRG